MTQDTSPEFTGTFQFLNRRLQDSATFGSLINEINTFANFAAKSTIGILSSVSYNEIFFSIFVKNILYRSLELMIFLLFCRKE